MYNMYIHTNIHTNTHTNRHTHSYTYTCSWWPVVCQDIHHSVEEFRVSLLTSRYHECELDGRRQTKTTLDRLCKWGHDVTLTDTKGSSGFENWLKTIIVVEVISSYPSPTKSSHQELVMMMMIMNASTSVLVAILSWLVVENRIRILFERKPEEGRLPWVRISRHFVDKFL